jgi:hypothetical protein
MKSFKHIITLALAASALMQSCKKDESLLERKAVPTDGLSSSQSRPKASLMTLESSYFKNFPITFINKTSSPTAEVSYQWCKLADKKFTVFATSKDIPQQFYAAPTKDTIALIATNIFGSDTLIYGFEVQDVPKSSQIYNISLDSLNFINPVTNQAWNATGGPNVLFKFFDSNNNWVDSTVFGTNGNQYGWASLLTASQIPSLTLSNLKQDTLPLAWKYPSSIKNIRFNQMVYTTTLKVYNKDDQGNLTEIAAIPFHFIDYFRKSIYAQPAPSEDFSFVKLRSADGKTVLTVKIEYKT